MICFGKHSMSVTELIADLTRRGARLSISDDRQLSLSVPAESLSEGLGAELARRPAEVIAYLLKRTACHLIERTVARVAACGRDYQPTPKAEAGWREIEASIDRACKAEDLQALRIALRDYEAFATSEFSQQLKPACSLKQRRPDSPLAGQFLPPSLANPDGDSAEDLHGPTQNDWSTDHDCLPPEDQPLEEWFESLPVDRPPPTAKASQPRPLKRPRPTTEDRLF